MDYREYEKGQEVSEDDFQSIGMVRDKFHSEWNYTISPIERVEISL
jgi:hypothetical protein